MSAFDWNTFWLDAPEWSVGIAMDNFNNWIYFENEPVSSKSFAWKISGRWEKVDTIWYSALRPVTNWRESWTPKPITETMATEPTIEHLTLGGQAPALLPPVKPPIDDGEPAFPTLNGLKYNDGMSLRDYFAGQWLAGLGSSSESSNYLDEIAKGCYRIADAMLEARTVKPE